MQNGTAPNSSKINWPSCVRFGLPLEQRDIGITALVYLGMGFLFQYLGKREQAMEQYWGVIVWGIVLVLIYISRVAWAVIKQLGIGVKDRVWVAALLLVLISVSVGLGWSAKPRSPEPSTESKLRQISNDELREHVIGFSKTMRDFEAKKKE